MDLNTRLVWYSDHEHLSDCQMVCYSNAVLIRLFSSYPKDAKQLPPSKCKWNEAQISKITRHLNTGQDGTQFRQ